MDQCFTRRLKIILGSAQLLSKRPEMFLLVGHLITATPKVVMSGILQEKDLLT